MSKSRLWALIAVLAALFVPLVAVGCGDDGDDGGGGGVETAEEGKLLVGTDTPYAPFEIGQPPDITGYDIEIMNALAEEMGLEVTYQDTGFKTIFRDVAQGIFDTAAAASSIKPPRQEVVNFSDPYYVTSQVVLVTEDSDIASAEDISGIVGAQDATTGEDYANEETNASEVRGYPEGPDAIAALVTGQVEAVIIDQAVAADAAEKQEGLKVVQVIPTEEFYGFAVSKQKPNLLAAMNEALKTIKDNGTFAKIYKKYFGAAPPRNVLEGTTENP